MISSEPRQPNLVVVTGGGPATRADQNTQQGHLQVRPTTQKKASLDVQQEKEVFLEEQQDFVVTNQLLTSGEFRAMPKTFEQLIKNPPMKNVSKLKEFFKICLALIHDRDGVAVLTTL